MPPISFKSYYELYEIKPNFRSMNRWFVLYFCLYGLGLSAQTFAHRKHRYQWDEHQTIPIEVHEMFQSYNAVVLHQETRISLINHSFRQYKRIRFLNEEGIRLFNQISFANPVDPISFLYKHPLVLQDTIYQPKLGVDDFYLLSARIIRQGEYVNAVLKEIVEPQKVWRNGQRILQYAYHVYVRNLQPGDELEWVYSHRLPSVMRFTLHEKIPVQSSVVEVWLPSHRRYHVSCNDSGVVRDSLRMYKKRVLFDRIRFEAINRLPVDIISAGSYAVDLPAILFYPISDSISEGLFSTAKPVYYYWKNKLFDEVTSHNEFYEGVSGVIHSESRQVIDQLFRSAVGTYPLSATHAMRAIHHYLTDAFSYKNDYGYEAGYDTELENLADYLDKKILRQRSRYRVYSELMNRLDTVYYLMHIPDKRVNRLQNAYFQPLQQSVIAFGAGQLANMNYYLPREAHASFYENELPFYLQGMHVWGIPQQVSSEMYYHQASSIQFPLLQTPMYADSVNLRYAYSTAHISFHDNEVHFRTSLMLQGNFSTSTRGLYKYDSKDSSLFRSYHQRIYDLNGKSTKLTTISTQNKVYPFTSSWEFTYTTPLLLSKKDSVFVLNLTGACNLLYMPIPKSSQMHMTMIRPDFSYSDKFVYNYTLSQPARLLNASEYTFVINNACMKMESSVFQKSDTEICVRVNCAILCSEISAIDADLYFDFQRRLKKIFDMQLAFQIL